jgi:hypothetical protein
MSDGPYDERPRRRQRVLIAVGFSALAIVAVVLIVVWAVGQPSLRRAAPPAPPSMPPAPSPLLSYYPPPIQSASDGHLATTYATQILTYTPYVNDIPRPGLAITATDSSMDSTTDPSSGCTAVAHDLAPLRCISPDGPIYDPCFPNVESSSCLFVASPGATNAVRVLLGPPTPAQPPQPSVSPNLAPGESIAHPWVLDLTDGTECVFEHGAEDNVGGLRPNYRCSDGRFAFGDPDETRSGWTVQLGASQSGPLTQQIGVSEAWVFAYR